MTADNTSDPWQGIAGDIRAAVAELFTRNGASDADALDAASRVTKTIAFVFGGRQVYLPRFDRLKIADRDRAIFRDSNGKNQHELATRYGITQRHLQRIVKQQAEAYRAERAESKKRE